MKGEAALQGHSARSQDAIGSAPTPRASRRDLQSDRAVRNPKQKTGCSEIPVRSRTNASAAGVLDCHHDSFVAKRDFHRASPLPSVRIARRSSVGSRRVGERSKAVIEVVPVERQLWGRTEPFPGNLRRTYLLKSSGRRQARGFSSIQSLWFKSVRPSTSNAVSGKSCRCSTTLQVG